MHDNFLERAGWSVRDFGAATNLSRSTLWRLVRAGKLRTARIGGRRIIIESPTDFLAKSEASR